MRVALVGLVGLVGVLLLCALYVVGVVALPLLLVGLSILVVASLLYLVVMEWGRVRARSALARSAKRHQLEAVYGPLPSGPPSIEEAVRAQVWGHIARTLEDEVGDVGRERYPIPSAPRIPGKGLAALIPETSSITASEVPPLDSPRASQTGTHTAASPGGPIRVVVSADALVQPLLEEVAAPGAEARRLMSRPSKSSSSASRSTLVVPPVEPAVVGVVPVPSDARVFPASTGKPRKKRPAPPPPAPPKKRTVGDMYRPVVAVSSVPEEVTGA